MKKLGKLSLREMINSFDVINQSDSKSFIGGDTILIDGVNVIINANDCSLQAISYLTGTPLEDVIREQARHISARLGFSYESSLLLSTMSMSTEEEVALLDDFNGSSCPQAFYMNRNLDSTTLAGSCPQQYENSIANIPGQPGHTVTLGCYLGSGIYEYWDEQNQFGSTISLNELYSVVTN